VEWAIASHGIYESALILILILKQKNLYIVGCVQCIWDITAYLLLPELKYIYLPIYILSYNQTLAYSTNINFFPSHFNNFLEENLSKSPSFSQLLPVVIPSWYHTIPSFPIIEDVKWKSPWYIDPLTSSIHG